MSSGARAALRSTQGSSFFGSLLFGILLIVIGLNIETERYKAMSVITGIVIILRPIAVLFRSGSKSQPQVSMEEKIQKEEKELGAFTQRKNIARTAFALGAYSLVISFMDLLPSLSDTFFTIGVIGVILGGPLWVHYFVKWDNINGNVSERTLNQLPKKILHDQLTALKRNRILTLSVWLLFWAINWILVFTDVITIRDSKLYDIVISITLTGFAFMVMTINLYTREHWIKVTLS